MNNEQMVICVCGLFNDKDKVLGGASADENLTAYVTQYRTKLESKGIEIFNQVNNILVAEDGYYIAQYAKDLEKIEDGK